MNFFPALRHVLPNMSRCLKQINTSHDWHMEWLRERLTELRRENAKGNRQTESVMQAHLDELAKHGLDDSDTTAGKRIYIGVFTHTR